MSDDKKIWKKNTFDVQQIRGISKGSFISTGPLKLDTKETTNKKFQTMDSPFNKIDFTHAIQPVKFISAKPATIQKTFNLYRVTTEGEQILSENIKINPFNFLSLLELSITQQQGDHAIANFKGIISKEDAMQTLKTKSTVVLIDISKRNEDGKNFTFYRGIATSIEVTNEGDVYYVKGNCASYTYLLDIKKRRRSFQLKEQSYEQLINEIVSEYSEAAFLDTISNNKKTNQFLTQFDETDWEFIKRLASHFNRQIAAIDQYDSSKFYFGLPDTSITGEVKAVEFQAEKDLGAYRYLKENHQVSADEQAFLRYRVKTNQLFVFGDKVKFLDQEWYVVQLERTIDRGELFNHYLLTKVQGIMHEKVYNETLIGSSIVGSVKAVNEDKVLLDLEIDQNRKNAAYWFDYSTNYTSDDNVGWYMMPEIGELVRPYYPTKDEKDAVAMATIRTEDDSSSSLDPSIKTLRNKYGKTITLEPNRITITGNGVEIILNDSSGINITSTGSVSVSAEGPLSLKGKNVILDGSDSVNISSHGNTISVNDKIVLNGSQIKMN